MSCDSEHNKFDITKKECYLCSATYFPWMEIFVEIIVYWNKNNNRTITWLLEGIASSIICKVANDATRDTIIYACQKSCDYHYIIICNTVHKAKSLPQRAKWKHNKNLINSTNFSPSFQTPSIFCPHEVAIQFLSVSWLNRWFVFWFSIVLLVDMNSQLCFRWVDHRLDGDECLHDLIPVHALGVNAQPFSVFTSAKNFCRISLYSQIHYKLIFLFSQDFSNFFTPHTCSLDVFCLSFLLNFIQLLVV